VKIHYLSLSTIEVVFMHKTILSIYSLANRLDNVYKPFLGLIAT